jgi:hypothetical protein
MSGFTMTQTEELYAADQAGTTTLIQTAYQSAIIGYPGLPFIPGGFFANVGSYRTSTAKLVWRGLLIATATVPTFTIGLGLSTTDAVAGSNTLCTTGAVTPAATTGSWFHAEITMSLRGPLVQGALNTISAHGFFDVCPAAASPVRYCLPASASTYSPIYTTYDPSIQYWITPGLALGAATSGNTLITHALKLYGEN